MKDEMTRVMAREREFNTYGNAELKSGGDA